MSRKEFVGYEYAEKAVKRSVASVYADGYENFGWKLEDAQDVAGKVDSVLLKFKRDRKICNKAELVRLQHQFDATIDEVLSLEGAKQFAASVVSCVIGILGTAFMAGSVFAFTGGSVPLCIILAVPAFIGWILPIFVFWKIKKVKTARLEPFIERKYDELYTVCERANSLLQV